MALTQEQKNTISHISQNPKEVLKDFKERAYYLKSFKDEFFQDGNGLLSKVLYQYFLTNDDNFFQLYQYIIENSNISIFDNKGHKPSALSYLDGLKGSFHDYPNKLFKVLEITDTSQINFHSYILERHIVDLYNSGMKEKASRSISKYKSFLTNYRDLLTVIIQNDDDLYFNSLIKKINLYDFKQIDFHKDFNNQSPFKNILYFSLENKSEKIAKILIEEFPDLVSNEKTSLYSNKKNTPILQSIHNESNLIRSILSIMDNKLLSYNFNHINHNGEKILTCFLNNHYSKLIEEKVIDLLNSNIENYEKNNLLKSVFESSITYDSKFFILSSGLEENISEKYSYTAIFNSFIFSVQRNPVISQNLFDQFINEFKIRDLISEDQVFNSTYFSNINYFKLIYNNYLFKQINPLGFVESWLKTGVKNKEQLIDEMDYIWFKISKLDFKKLNSSTASFSALHLMLVNNFDRYVNLFSTSNLDYLLKKNFMISSYKKNKDSTDFYEIVDKLLECEFSFKEDNNKILKLLSFNPPNKLVDKIITKNQISIALVSKETSFWSYIYSQNTFDYCINKNALIFPEHLVPLIYNYDLYPLELYLENKGDVNYLNEKGNILHILCQDTGNLKFEEMNLLIDYCPNLAIQTNKQNKFPVSYLISDFNKICKKYKENKNTNNKKTLDKYYLLIKNMFQCGLQTDNKKAYNILESQLLNYDNIIEVCPDLLPTLRAEKLSKKLITKGIKTKTIKI